MIELDQILEGLVQRTTEGKLKWRRGVREGQYVTSVDAISIVVMNDEFLEPLGYRLEILEESGKTVESLRNRHSTAEQGQQLERLHLEAHRSARESDPVLEKLARALEL